MIEKEDERKVKWIEDEGWFFFFKCQMVGERRKLNKEI